MNFSSILFLFAFLPPALLIYHALPKGRLLFLTLISYLFYAWADPRFVLLLIWVTIFDFSAGNIIGGHWRLTENSNGFAGGVPKKLKVVVLSLSLLNSLGLLCFFKYSELFQQIGSDVAGLTGRHAWVIRTIVLPAGISFYTFESLSYVIDIYRGVARPAGASFVQRTPAIGTSVFVGLKNEFRSFVAFACYLAQFPHLLAGPIIRYQELEPSLQQPRTSFEFFARGSVFFCIGLAKKVLIADVVARAADGVFNNNIGGLDAGWGILAYTLQIYFDFSGYTDMATGMGLMLGFEFPRNFNAPYRATSVSEFWRRWHMTLSSWLRDYLYIPLGGNRRSNARTYFNIIITMFLGGLWHGAAYQFAVWGLYHGIWLAIERALGRRSIVAQMARPAQTAVTFIIVAIGWVFFREATLGGAVYRLIILLAPNRRPTPADVHAVIYQPQIPVAMIAGCLIVFLAPQSWTLVERLKPATAVMAIVLFVAAVTVLAASASSPFLYFRF